MMTEPLLRRWLMILGRTLVVIFAFSAWSLALLLILTALTQPSLKEFLLLTAWFVIPFLLPLYVGARLERLPVSEFLLITIGAILVYGTLLPAPHPGIYGAPGALAILGLGTGHFVRNHVRMRPRDLWRRWPRVRLGVLAPRASVAIRTSLRGIARVLNPRTLPSRVWRFWNTPLPPPDRE